MKITTLAAAVLGSASLASSAFAASVQFNIVQASSSLAINGTLGGSPLTQQTPGSLATTYTGTINADLTGNTLTFTGGSSIDAAPQATNQQPGNNGNPGSAQADYGFTGAVSIFSALVAARNVNFDVTSGGLTVTGGAITGGTTLSFNTADIDYSTAIAFGREELDGIGGANAAVGATLVTVGNVQTLTLPISAIFNTSLFQSGDTTLNAAGTIVATRIVADVPEPTTLAALAGVAALAGRRRRGA